MLLQNVFWANMSSNGVKMNGDSAEWSMSKPLEDLDPEVYEIIKKEKRRQTASLEMIASENFTSTAVLDCLSSCLHNKYSEGQPGARYTSANCFSRLLHACKVIVILNVLYHPLQVLRWKRAHRRNREVVSESSQNPLWA